MAHKIRKILFLFILFLCITPTVFASGDRYEYNTSWNDDYLGLANIEAVFYKMGFPDFTETQVNTTYDTFISRYASLKELYPSINLRNIVFWQNSAGATSINKVTISISNGTFADNTVPYLKLVDNGNSSFYTNWVSGDNSEEIRAKSFYCPSSSLGTARSYINSSNFSVDTTEEDAYKIDGNIFSWSESYTVVYNDNFSFLVNPLPGLLIAENEYLLPEISEEPDNPSGDTGSGDTGGNTGDYTGQLNELQGSLNNIENKIPSSGDMQEIVSSEINKVIDFMSGDADFSGENTNISSGDIVGAIGYTPPDDPYANFWWELTEILNNALTGVNRTLTLQAINNTYTISIDDIGWNPPDVLRTFLTLLSTTVVCWVLIKYIKITIDKLSSGSIDEALAMNEESGIVDLF